LSDKTETKQEAKNKQEPPVHDVQKYAWMIGLVVVLLVMGVLKGFSALRMLLGFFVLSFPFYYLLGTWNFPPEEKALYAFFSSIAIVPIGVYYLGILFSSIQIALGVTFVLLVGVAYGVRKVKGKNKA
jgi:uncharacterized membrane protein